MTALARIMESDLAKSYRFETCIQDRPAGGINPGLIWQMARRMRSLRPDLLHVRGLQNEGFHGLLAGRLAGCKRILVSVHGFIGDIAHPSSPLRQKIVRDFLEPFTVRHADGVYCVCAYAARREVIIRNAKRHFNPIHNAVPLVPLTSPDLALRRSFSFSSDDVIGVCVSRVTREKGVWDLLRALEMLEKRGNQNLKVLLVGDGPDTEELRRSAALLSPNRLVLAGQRDDVHALLTMGDFFVFPTLHENLSNALLEAMSCARAVVATEVGGNCEVVVPNETGLLVPAANPSALADAMALIAADSQQRARMGTAGRRRVETHFSMPVLTHKLDAVYKDMLAS